MPHRPTVSVLMSVWNARRDVGDAIQSILAQTFADFEFIIIDDGSTDGSADLMASIDDKRIQIHRRTTNAGLTSRLNEAIGLARGRYLARTDADDVSTVRRLEKQITFLEANPHVALVGSFCRCIHEDRSEQTWVFPTSDDAIRAQLVRRNVFVHSSVMIRRTALDAVGLYDDSLRYVQDYELWGRLASRFAVGNIPEVLVTRHVHPNSLSQAPDLAWTRWKAHAAAQWAVARHLRRPLAAVWLIHHFLGYVKQQVIRKLSRSQASLR